MSLFVYAAIAFIIVQFVKHFIKHNREESQRSSNRFNWSESYSLRLRSVLKTCEGFSDDDIIDSAVGFYLFSYDSTAREFIFIENDGVIHWLPYNDLIEYKVREGNDYRIMIDLKTSFSGKPYISIECFDREKLLKKMPQLQYKLDEIDKLYELEREKIEEIEYILSEIIEEDNRGIADTPPPYKEEEIKKEPETVKVEISPIPVILADVVTAVKEVKEEAVTFIEKEIPIEIVEEAPAVYEIIPEREEIVPEPFPAVEEPASIPEPEVKEEAPVADGNVEVSLSEIEEYSRGKFLEYEVQSAVSDAKMRGKKYIYLTNEQLEKLKS